MAIWLPPTSKISQAVSGDKSKKHRPQTHGWKLNGNHPIAKSLASCIFFDDLHEYSGTKRPQGGIQVIRDYAHTSHNSTVDITTISTIQSPVAEGAGWQDATAGRVVVPKKEVSSIGTVLTIGRLAKATGYNREVGVYNQTDSKYRHVYQNSASSFRLLNSGYVGGPTNVTINDRTGLTYIRGLAFSGVANTITSFHLDRTQSVFDDQTWDTDNTVEYFSYGVSDAAGTERSPADDIICFLAWDRKLSNSEIAGILNSFQDLRIPANDDYVYISRADLAGLADALLADDVESASTVNTPTLTQVHTLTVTDVEAATTVSSPTVAESNNILTATSVESASTVSTNTLTQVHALATNDVESASTVSTPTCTSVAGHDTLLADDVEAASTVSTPTLLQVHVLTANGVESVTEVSVSNLGQVHLLAANDVEANSTVSSPAMDRQGIANTLIEYRREDTSINYRKSQITILYG